MIKFTTVVVGAGLAGLSAAYSLASRGIDVLVVERGDYPGAKNVSGGRVYLSPVKRFLPEIWQEAPLERLVVREIVTLMGETSSVSIELSTENRQAGLDASFTILRSRFDRWFADKAAGKGARIVTRTRVDDLLREEGRVKGIVAGGAQIHADVVVAADGAMSLIAEKVGLRREQRPADYAVGVKEIIELDAKTIEERFRLSEGQGEARLFIGALTQGMRGGGFLYTNQDTLSLGIVVKIKDLVERQPPVEVGQLLDEFKQRPELASLLKGGETVEYSAHTIPEGGFRTLSRLYSDGILVTGDAAGFVVNTGITIRGMDFAIASGVMAAQAIEAAKKKGDFSAQGLSAYESLLQESFVWKDLRTFRDAPRVLDNRRLFTLYPQLICGLLEKVMSVGEQPKQRISTTALKKLKGKLPFYLLKDLLEMRKI